MSMNHKSAHNGFTVVELLVVIVVIGILASLTIVSFTGVSQQAAVATLQSDLKNAATQIGIDYVNDGAYPLTEGDVNNGNGLPKSEGTIYSYQVYEDGYCIEATSNTVTSHHRFMSSVGTVESGACPKVWKQISASGNHICGIASDNQAYCWGYNGFGQVGDNTTTDALVPTAVDTSGVLAGKNLIYISAGWGHTCALDSDYLAYCWGYNGYGQLGDNTTNNSHVPVQVNVATVLGGRTIKAISTGYGHDCVIASDDNVYCWGMGTAGELGNASSTTSSTAVAVSTSGVLSGKTIKKISSVGETNCVIASDDLAYCWGAGGNGELGNNTTSNSNVPVAVNTVGVLSGKTILSIVTRGGSSCVIASDNHDYCWGSNTNGGLGNNSTSYSLVPVAVSTAGVLNGKSLQTIATGDTSCAIDTNNVIYCWGANSSGQLGINSTVQSLVPVAVDTSGVLSGKSLIDIQTGNSFTCALASNKQTYCWGANGSGTLGNNSTTQSLVPVQVNDIP
jgi:prepilin-type N-terminal cleavage/methylation domain-containing protein